MQRLVLRDRHDGHCAALGRVERDDVVALLHRGHAGAHVHHDARALVAEDGGKEALGVGARQGELVGVADAGRLDLDQDLACARAFEIDLGDLERLAGRKRDGCTTLHGAPSPDLPPGRSRSREGAGWGDVLGEVSLARCRRAAIEERRSGRSGLARPLVRPAAAPALDPVRRMRGRPLRQLLLGRHHAAHHADVGEEAPAPFPRRGPVARQATKTSSITGDPPQPSRPVRRDVAGSFGAKRKRGVSVAWPRT